MKLEKNSLHFYVSVLAFKFSLISQPFFIRFEQMSVTLTFPRGKPYIYLWTPFHSKIQNIFIKSTFRMCLKKCIFLKSDIM